MSSYYSDGRGRGSSSSRNTNPSSRNYSNGSGRKRKKKRKVNYGRFGVFLLLVVLLIICVVAGIKLLTGREENGDSVTLNEEQAAEETDTSPLDTTTIYEGVSINGISVSGMTREAAVAAVQESLATESHVLTLAYNDLNFSVPLLSGSNLSEVVENAYALGRTGTEEERLLVIESLKASPKNLTVEAGYSLPDMADIMAECSSAINRQARNATVTGYDNEFIYSESQKGLAVDEAATIALLQSAVDGGSYDSTVQIVVNETEPEMSLEALKEKFVKIASFTTKTTSNSNRNTNIRLCSSALNGTVVQPGEEFSVNTITGKRSAEKGYMDATVIKNGVYIQEPGGGVCQVSSTLYNAVVRAGFEITERYNHTIVSSYVNIGEDAAIDYPSKDFRFVNNSSGPIVVLFSFDEANRKLTAKVYGIPILDSDTTLDLYSEVYETQPIPSPTYTEDPTLSPGEEVTVTSGIEGQKVKTYLITYKDGKEVDRKQLYTSSYPKRTPVIAINSAASTIPSESGVPSEGGEATPVPSSESDIPSIPEE